MIFWGATIIILIILFSKLNIFLLNDTNVKQKFVNMASCSLCQQLQEVRIRLSGIFLRMESSTCAIQNILTPKALSIEELT